MSPRASLFTVVLATVTLHRLRAVVRAEDVLIDTDTRWDEEPMVG